MTWHRAKTVDELATLKFTSVSPFASTFTTWICYKHYFLKLGIVVSASTDVDLTPQEAFSPPQAWFGCLNVGNLQCIQIITRWSINWSYILLMYPNGGFSRSARGKKKTHQTYQVFGWNCADFARKGPGVVEEAKRKGLIVDPRTWRGLN